MAGNATIHALHELHGPATCPCVLLSSLMPPPDMLHCAAAGAAGAGTRPAPHSKLLSLLDRRHGAPATDMATSLSGSVEPLNPGSTKYGSDLPDAGTMALAKMQGKVEVGLFLAFWLAHGLLRGFGGQKHGHCLASLQQRLVRPDLASRAVAQLSSGCQCCHESLCRPPAPLAVPAVSPPDSGQLKQQHWQQPG